MNPLTVDWFATLSLTVLSISMVLAFIRIVKGPTIADRVVATDLLASVCVAIFALYAVYTDNLVMLDVALFLALLSFLTTVAFAYYIDKRRLGFG